MNRALELPNELLSAKPKTLNGVAGVETQNQKGVGVCGHLWVRTSRALAKLQALNFIMPMQARVRKPRTKRSRGIVCAET